MIFITASVENNFLDTFFFAFGSKQLSYKFSLFNFFNPCLGCNIFFPGACRQKGDPVQVVNNLNIDLFIAAVDCKPWGFCSAVYLSSGSSF